MVRFCPLKGRGCLLLFVSCSTSQQHLSVSQGRVSHMIAGVSQGRICSHNCTYCHTDRDLADQTFHLTSHSILTSGQPVPVLTLYRKEPGIVATAVPVFGVTGMTGARKNTHRENGEWNPGQPVWGRTP